MRAPCNACETNRVGTVHHRLVSNSTVQTAGRQLAVNALGEVIAEHRRRTGETQTAFAESCGLRRQTIMRLATAPRLARLPNPSTIDALARGLEMPREQITRVIIESMGVNPDTDVDYDASTLRVIQQMSEMTPPEREAMVALGRSVLYHHRRI